MKNRILTFGFFISLLLTGCVMYHPMPTDVPLISKKKDLRVDAGTSIVPSIHTTISYGLTDEIAIQGFGCAGVGDRYYLQSAAGLYKNFDNQCVLEIYGGMGYGHGKIQKEFDFYEPGGTLIGNYQLVYGQIDFGKICKESKGIELGFGLKSGCLSSNFEDRNYYEWISETGPYKTSHDISILLEPIGIIRVGGPSKIKLSVKLGGTMIYKLTNTDKHFPYKNLNLGVGLNFRL